MGTLSSIERYDI
jgi:hypothetical protein